MAETEPMAEVARRDPDFVFVQPGAHYDGVYYYAMARDPFATGREHTLIDAAANRYGHPAYGWVAAAVSFGRLRALPNALVVVSVVSIVVATVLAARLYRALGWSPWAGLAVALHPGLQIAVSSDTSEAFGAALMLGVLLAWLTGHRVAAAVLIVPLCFAKEPMLAIPVGLAAWEGLAWLRARGPRIRGARRLLRRWALLAIGPAVYAVWLAYVRTRFGVYPFQQGLDAIAFPLVGWADTLNRAGSLAAIGFYEMQIGQAMVAILAVTIGALLVGVVSALRFRTPIDPIYLLLSVLMVSLTWYTTLYPKELVRNLAFAFILLPFVLLGRREPSGGTIASHRRPDVPDPPSEESGN